MTIKTKYNLGDKVWVMAVDGPTQFHISNIEAYLHQNMPQSIWYIDDNDEGYAEEFVSPTKEELLKSL